MRMKLLASVLILALAVASCLPQEVWKYNVGDEVIFTRNIDQTFIAGDEVKVVGLMTLKTGAGEVRRYYVSFHGELYWIEKSVLEKSSHRKEG